MEIEDITVTSLTAAKDLYDFGTQICWHDSYEGFNMYIKLARPILESQMISQADKERVMRNSDRIKEHMLQMNELVDEMITNLSIIDTRARHKARDELREMGSTKELSQLLARFLEDALCLKQLLRDGDPTFLASSDFTPIDADNRVAASMPNALPGKGRLANPRNDVP
ncbi:hypothetical protein QQZ08_005805 [Neonectria magnoliae]|uniref:Uncharacterized protein n=1 Tax=Neonectria magnoliae TaxID=2732573 RepID=A0ABR1I3R8_9HYPO